MTDKHNPYRLPDRAPSMKGDHAFEPKRFKRRIEALPMGDVGRVSQAIYQLLKPMNSTTLAVSSRLSNLEALLEPLQITLRALSKHFCREPVPLGKRASVMAELHDTLCILAAQGYKVILDQYHHESFTGHLLHRANRTLALHRQLFFLGQGLLHAYQLYRPAPRYLWREIHAVHRYAFDQKLAERRVDNEDQRLVNQSTVNDLYKQLLLLSLAGPYRLMQGEVARVFMALMRWAPKVRLRDLGTTRGDEAEGAFIVDVGVDNPSRFKGAKCDHQVVKGWVLDTRDLVASLAGEREAMGGAHGVMRPEERLDKVSPELMARLMLTWGIGCTRMDKRDETSGEVVLICGLKAIYATLGGAPISRSAHNPGTFMAANLEVKRPPKTRGVSPTSLEVDEYVIDDDIELIGMRQWLNRSNLPGAVRSPTTGGITPRPADAEVPAAGQVGPAPRGCKIYNRSRNGYHLGWTGGSEEQIRVGELVAISNQDEVGKDRWRLGVIRWMRQEHPEVIDFGVELFPGDIMPVIFTRQWGQTGRSDHWPGLLQQRPDEGPTLITTPFYSEANEKAWLTVSDEKHEVLMCRVIEATASFIQFYYRDPVPKADAGRDEEQDFEQLWTHH